MANISTGGLLKYFGLMGSSGVHTGSLVPRANTPDADARLWSDFQDSGRVADPDIWTKYNTVMKRPATFESMLSLWEEMSGWDLIAAALVEIVDEATQSDSNSPGTLWYVCNDQEFAADLNNMLVRLNVEDVLTSQVWHIAAYGNHFEKLEYAPQEGIIGMSYVHPMEMRRYWLERNRRVIGYRWLNHKPNKDDIFVMPDNSTPVERVSMTNGKDTEDLWYPWDFMHFRRMYRMRQSEHGEPIFAEADGIYKKLRLALDQMVVHRAQVQPDRYAINIDTQEQPPIEQMRTMQRWRQALRSKLAFGQGGDGNSWNSASDFQSYHNTLALDTILYLAQPKGFSNTITKLPGTPDVPDVYDIELLTDLFYSIIGMPRSWFGGQSDGGSNPPSGKALLAQDIRFLRKIKSIRRPVVAQYEWLGYFHAALMGKNLENLDIKVKMTPIGSLEEQMKLELLKMQSEVLDGLGDIMEKYHLPREAWVETIFKRYMHLPDDIVNVFLTALPNEVEAGEANESAAPTTRKIIQEIESKYGSAKFKDVARQLREVADNGPTPETGRRKMRISEVINQPKIKDPDIVISSFGKHPFELKRSNESITESKTGASTKYSMSAKTSVKTKWDDDKSTAESVAESSEAPPVQPKEPAYRKYI